MLSLREWETSNGQIKGVEGEIKKKEFKEVKVKSIAIDSVFSRDRFSPGILILNSSQTRLL